MVVVTFGSHGSNNLFAELSFTLYSIFWREQIEWWGKDWCISLHRIEVLTHLSALLKFFGPHKRMIFLSGGPCCFYHEVFGYPTNVPKWLPVWMRYRLISIGERIDIVRSAIFIVRPALMDDSACLLYPPAGDLTASFYVFYHVNKTVCTGHR